MSAVAFFFAVLGLAYLLVGLCIWAWSMAFGDVSEHSLLDNLKWFAACVFGWIVFAAHKEMKW